MAQNEKSLYPGLRTRKDLLSPKPVFAVLIHAALIGVGASFEPKPHDVNVLYGLGFQIATTTLLSDVLPPLVSDTLCSLSIWIHAGWKKSCTT